MADWGSRMVPPPMVPTSIEGIETEIWRLPFTLSNVSKLQWLWGIRNAYLFMMVMQLADSTTCAGS
jgi:hypothetical protein